MTRREAAFKILWRCGVNFEPYPTEVMHAIDIAIEALRKESSPRDIPNQKLLAFSSPKLLSTNYQEPKCEDCKWNTCDNNCMVEYHECRFEPKNGE